ncbi:MAG: hypothetical protein ACI857_000030 [Arenicella sp.]|jgi:hypothetical protein
MELNQKHVDIFRATYKSGERNFEETLLALRESGAWQLDCVKLIKSELNIPLKEADAIVLNSKTWSDHLDSTVNLRDQFFDAFQNSDEEE